MTSILALSAGLVLLSGAVGLRLARADQPTLGSYSLAATAPGYEFTEDEPAAQAHPEGQGSIPETSTILANGGLGYALATVAWPGSYGGNAGNLLLVATPSSVGGVVPVPDAVGQAEKQFAPSLQYPIRAEAHEGSQTDATFNSAPGAAMTAHADGSHVSGDASLQSVTQQGVGTFGNIHSASSSDLEGTLGKATATSVVHDIDFGGVIKIKSVTSTATAQTNGTKSSSTGGTIVDGMTIAGQQAYVDQGGVHIGQSSQPANATANQLVNQTLAQSGMKIYVSQPQQTVQGSSASYTSGSLLFLWIPPSNPSQNVFTMTVGGARVSVAAGEGFGTSATDETPAVGSVGDTGGGTGVLPATVGQSTSPAVDTGAGSTPAVAGTRTPGSSSLAGARPLAKTFGGMGAGWIFVGLAGVGLLAVGSRRLLGDLLDNPTATCPLEVRR